MMRRDLMDETLRLSLILWPSDAHRVDCLLASIQGGHRISQGASMESRKGYGGVHELRRSGTLLLGDYRLIDRGVQCYGEYCVHSLPGSRLPL